MTPNEAIFRSLASYLEHEPTPMIVLDTNYDILAANLAYRRQFTTPGSEVLGHKCYRISHQYSVPCDQAGEHCPMKQALSSRGPNRVLHVHHTPRGQEHVDVELRPVLDAEGAVIAFVERLNSVNSASVQPRETGLVGRSEAFKLALSSLRRAAPSQIPVLLQGESGTGKELFARALHDASPRAGKPLVVVDCTGLSENLFESELFGHERGAFTGALQRKIGLVETAHGGTLFLDEIGDVPLPMQAKLLRLIESGTYRRVGGIDTLHSDFRLVAATHKPLDTMVAEGAFRQDLYYRINAFPVHLPPLRERREDIPLLANSLLSRLAPGNQSVRLDDEAIEALKSHAFPGNVRELRNLLERARLFSDDGVIRLRDLALTPENTVMRRPDPAHHTSEKARLSHALVVFEGTRAELAQHLGLSERTLYRRLKTHGLA